MGARLHEYLRGMVASVCLVAAAVVSSLAAAQQSEEASRSLALDRFQTPVVQRTSLGVVETSGVVPHGVPVVGLQFEGRDDPLEAVGRRGEDRRVIDLIDERYRGRLAVGLGLFDRLSVGMALPIVHQTGRSLLDSTGRTRELAPWAFGDLELAAKWRIVQTSGMGAFGVAAALRVFAPVGDPRTYNSAGAVRAEPSVAVDWRPFEDLEFALEVGWEVRPRRTILDRVSDDRLTFGVGSRFPVGVWRFRGLVNVVGDVPVAASTGGEGGAVPYAEVIGGLDAPITPRWHVRILGGSGLTSALGSPDIRVTAGIEYAPVARDADGDTVADRSDRCPEKSEDLDGFRDDDGCPDPDNDGDGIPDDEDGCADRAEDPDGFEDEDGCPDPDNDGDEIPDASDACPEKPGVEWKSGCPFVDSDGDGIDDTRDGAPNAPEDEDGYQDEDGVPDPDNDGDGIPDDEDECPNEAEVVNGIEDEDGCPDEGESAVTVSEGEIEIDERVFFDTDRATIQQRSYNVLEEVAAALKSHREIEKVRVEGHTDGKGEALYNLALSQRRANAVRKFLVDQGVDEDRLESRGYGESEPVASNDTEEGRRENRRVEITILEVRESAGSDDSNEE